MYDLGHKSEVETVAPSKPSEIWYPSMTLRGEEIPELEDKKVGSKVSLKMIGIIKGITKEEKRGTEYNIEFKKCEVLESISEDEYKDLSDEEKDKLDKENVEENVDEKELSKDDTEE